MELWVRKESVRDHGMYDHVPTEPWLDEGLAMGATHMVVLCLRSGVFGAVYIMPYQVAGVIVDRYQRGERFDWISRGWNVLVAEVYDLRSENLKEDLRHNHGQVWQIDWPRPDVCTG